MALLWLGTIRPVYIAWIFNGLFIRYILRRELSVQENEEYLDGSYIFLAYATTLPAIRIAYFICWCISFVHPVVICTIRSLPIAVKYLAASNMIDLKHFYLTLSNSADFAILWSSKHVR